MKICITHIKNEEYLLPWWIMNHINKFDMVYVIDYNSTDNSLNIIREMAPHWVILQSKNEKFAAIKCDQEVMDLERKLFEQYEKPVVIALNVTEFLIGNTSFLDNIGQQDYVKYILTAQMCDIPENFDKEPDPKIPLTQQRTHGFLEQYDYINYMDNPIWIGARESNVLVASRMMRCMHNIPVEYPVGRHYWREPIEHLLLTATYLFSPFTKKMIDRKCSIQHNIPEEDIMRGMGHHHIVDESILKQRASYLIPHVKDLKKHFSEIENIR
jgi:hypothetical protein